MKRKLIPLVVALTAAANMATANPQGVTDDKITVGSIAELSGPLAIWGVPTANGLKMRIDEANAAGGVHGRKIDLIIEDAQYQVPQAVRFINKMVQRDKIFASLGTLGTPQNLAIMKILDKKGIPNLFPLTGAGSMAEPLHPLHFSYFVSYQNQARGAVKYFHDKGAEKLCLQTVATDYGQETVEGVEAAVDELGLEIVLHGTHKPTETDFAGVATAIKNAGCDVLVMGTTVKDSINLYATLRKLGWDKPIVGNMVAYLPLVAAAGNGVTEGLYAVSPFRIADFKDGDAWRAAFHENYTKAFGEEPAVQAQVGYVSADLFIKALEAVGPDLTVEALTTALEGITDYQDPFGGPNLGFSPEKHAGGNVLVLVQSRDKGWVVLEDDLPF